MTGVGPLRQTADTKRLWYSSFSGALPETCCNCWNCLVKFPLVELRGLHCLQDADGTPDTSGRGNLDAQAQTA